MCFGPSKPQWLTGAEIDLWKRGASAKEIYDARIDRAHGGMDRWGRMDFPETHCSVRLKSWKIERELENAATE